MISKDQSIIIIWCFALGHLPRAGFSYCLYNPDLYWKYINIKKTGPRQVTRAKHHVIINDVIIQIMILVDDKNNKVTNGV